MSDLHDDTRHLLRAAATADDPTSSDRDRVRAKLTAALIAGTATTAATAKAATVATKLTLAASTKLALVLAITTAAAVTYKLVAKPAPTPTPLVSASAPEPEPQPVPSPSAPPSPSPSASAPVRPAPAVAPASAPVPPRRSTLSAETADLSAIRTALSTDPSRALTLLDRFDRAHPRAHLAQEAAVARIDALCRLDRLTDAATAISAFLAAYPDSPHAKKVTHACSH